MSWLPKSPKARRRLTLLAAIAPVLALAVGLTLWGLRDSISFFYTPSQAAKAQPPLTIRPTGNIGIDWERLRQSKNAGGGF